MKILTLDTDWAPDFTIDNIAQILIEKKVKATWFVTHSSPAINRLRKYPNLFELGIHPNFYPNSTHGKTEDEVMSHIKEVVPEAISMRTHGLYQNSRLLSKAASRYGVKIDVSLFLPYTPHLQPHILNLDDNRLLRIPYFWEDDFEMYKLNPCFSLSHDNYHCEGLKLFDFHPIHIILNSYTMENYNLVKSKHNINTVTLSELEPYINKSGEGTGTFFKELVELIETSSYSPGLTICDLSLKWMSLK